MSFPTTPFSWHYGKPSPGPPHLENAPGNVAVARISPARALARFRYSQIAIVEGLTYLAVKFPSISLPSLNVTKNFPEIDFRLPLHP